MTANAVSLASLCQAARRDLRGQFQNDSSGHDWFHVERVAATAKQIAIAEGANPELAELAGLLHDIADWKFFDGDEHAGPRAAEEWLQQAGAPAPTIAAVTEIVATVSFKGAGVTTQMATREGACVQDADRLDAIGAIGVARAFAFGGHFGRLMFDPAQPPVWHSNFGEYKSKAGPTVNHFYEKLFLLKDRMQTATGRTLAAERHAFLETFLKQFFAEWGVMEGLNWGFEVT